ncbi:hypothetical protein AS592_06380 [Sulfurovum riftiae]|uniref:Serine kinase n=1 Tax=Sulfurovum riftiae TaxID=1630136 RepID=A0A151CFX4_9BACT|nr:hypothetical protein AS592_06380 [Sulfurovum riftiae]
MIVYGTKINSDIDFLLDFSQETETRQEIELSSKVPESLKKSITSGIPLFFSHNRYINLYSDRQMDENIVGQPWCYEVQDIATFYWVSGQKIIYYNLEKSGSMELLVFWFVHQILPLWLTLEGYYDFIHAGSVEIEGKIVAFIAPSMGGKSTLTDYFIRQGHPLVTDDKLPTFFEQGHFMAVGSHPYHRPFREFEVFGYHVKKFMKRSDEIRAFYLLEQGELESETRIEEITGYEKFDLLQPSYLYEFSFLRLGRLRYLGRMLDSLKVYRVTRPWNLEKLPEVYEAIHGHIRRLG